ncbi:MAG: hypothetical protein H0W30_16060 [Gemmatimonadaceae bacterium]|nr:hypothetical protein [Gemmatimonadaceae bacterium]
MNEQAALKALKASPDLAKLFEDLLKRIAKLENELGIAKSRAGNAGAGTGAILNDGQRSALLNPQQHGNRLDPDIVIGGLTSAQKNRLESEGLTPDELIAKAEGTLRRRA